MKNACMRTISCLTLLFVISCVSTIVAQDKKEPVKKETAKKITDKDKKTTDKKKKAPIVISDEPKTVDPAKTIQKALATRVTVDFKNSSLREVVAWLKKEQKLTVLLDKKAISRKGILLGESFVDRANNEPLYLMLNRLRSLGLAWYMKDDILHITTTEIASKRTFTKSYKVGDLLDSGVDASSFLIALSYVIEGERDDDPAEWLGDVLFVRQTDQFHRKVAGLMAALRKHGRRTFIADPPIHQKMKDKMTTIISVKFDETPLNQAIRVLADKSKIDIRLHQASLQKIRVRDRQPVSLTLENRKLSTVLLSDLNLTLILRDGVIWVTSEGEAKRFLKTAMFDVRDLCQDETESEALSEAIESQTTESSWSDEGDDDSGTIVFLKPGIMVVRQTENCLDQISNLLDIYRKALRDSKPRRQKIVDTSNDVITHYYQLNDNIAIDLMKILPTLVEPKTWQSKENPKAIGTILKLTSEPAVINATMQAHADGKGGANKTTSHAVVIPRSVLIIRQTQKTHQKILSVIHRIEKGDPSYIFAPNSGFGGQGGGGFNSGGGQGGFGGGYFLMPDGSKPSK